MQISLLFPTEPKATVLRAPEMHVGVGSLINLTCIVPYSPETPEYLHWYHKERVQCLFLLVEKSVVLKYFSTAFSVSRYFGDAYGKQQTIRR